MITDFEGIKSSWDSYVDGFIFTEIFFLSYAHELQMLRSWVHIFSVFFTPFKEIISLQNFLLNSFLRKILIVCQINLFFFIFLAILISSSEKPYLTFWCKKNSSQKLSHYSHNWVLLFLRQIFVIDLFNSRKKLPD